MLFLCVVFSNTGQEASDTLYQECTAHRTVCPPISLVKFVLDDLSVLVVRQDKKQPLIYIDIVFKTLATYSESLLTGIDEDICETSPRMLVNL